MSPVGPRSRSMASDAFTGSPTPAAVVLRGQKRVVAPSAVQGRIAAGFVRVQSHLQHHQLVSGAAQLPVKVLLRVYVDGAGLHLLTFPHAPLVGLLPGLPSPAGIRVCSCKPGTTINQPADMGISSSGLHVPTSRPDTGCTLWAVPAPYDTRRHGAQVRAWTWRRQLQV